MSKMPSEREAAEVPDEGAMTIAPNATPRTPEQVRFEPDLPWEKQDAMYRQCVADGGLTMGYGERAREVLRCSGTAADGRLTESQQEHLEAIGRLLIVWEGSLHLLEERAARIEDEHAARGALLDVAGAEIARLRSLLPQEDRPDA
jgi:hypothetical protein